MKSLFCLVVCLLTYAPLAAQVTTAPPNSASPAVRPTATGTLKVRAALVDKDLNVKPIPKLVLILRDNAQPTNQLTFVTDFDGQSTVSRVFGNYILTTAHPVDFQGKRYSWSIPVTIQSTGTVVELSNDNASIQDIVTVPARRTDELTTLFTRYEGSVVTVWSEFGHGTGFIVDPEGLILTNQHVIGPSEYIAVQFDEHTKLPAVLLTADAQKDVAVLWVNIVHQRNYVVAPLANTKGGEPSVVEGERVFTIGSPLSQRKILTTGVVSRVEKHAIISDININPGNSGGPLFNSLGSVVGLTTFAESEKRGPGISGVVRIEEALPLLS